MTDLPLAFTCRSARSTGITGVLIAVTLIETTGLHLLLVHRVPALAYLLTVSSLAFLAWFIRDFRALGRQPALTIGGRTVHVTIGLRITGQFERSAIAEVIRPTWRDQGVGAPPSINGTKPASPNVLIVFNTPQTLTLVGAVRRPVTRLALHVDDADGCIAALTQAPGHIEA